MRERRNLERLNSDGAARDETSVEHGHSILGRNDTPRKAIRANSDLFQTPHRRTIEGQAPAQRFSLVAIPKWLVFGRRYLQLCIAGLAGLDERFGNRAVGFGCDAALESGIWRRSVDANVFLSGAIEAEWLTNGKPPHQASLRAGDSGRRV